MTDDYSASLTIPAAFYTGKVRKQLDRAHADGADVHPYVDARVVSVSDVSAEDGEFEDLEEWLVNHGVPFDRHSDGYCDGYMQIPPCVRSYRPAEGDRSAVDVEYNLTESGEAYLARDDVLRCLEGPADDVAMAIRALIERECPVVRPLADCNLDNVFQAQ